MRPKVRERKTEVAGGYSYIGESSQFKTIQLSPSPSSTYVVEETVDLAGGPNPRDLVTVVAEKLAPSVGLRRHVLSA
jgi:hypothetical protein